MSETFHEVRSTDQARQEAERHRRELAQTLDTLALRLNKTVEKAEETREKVREKVDNIEQKARMPLEWFRAHPLPALGISIGIGLLLALSSEKPEKRRRPRMRELNQHFGIHVDALHRAYLEGRQDERKGRAIRALTTWQDFQPRKSSTGELWAAGTEIINTVRSGLAAIWHGGRALRKARR